VRERDLLEELPSERRTVREGRRRGRGEEDRELVDLGLHLELEGAHAAAFARAVREEDEVTHALDELAEAVEIEARSADELRQVEGDREAAIFLAHDELFASITCRLHVYADVLEGLHAVEALEGALKLLCDGALAHEPRAVPREEALRSRRRPRCVRAHRAATDSLGAHWSPGAFRSGAIPCAPSAVASFSLPVLSQRS
jgi:hypothetical protein